MISIKKIPAQSTWQMRHIILWPDQPLSYVHLKDDEQGLHYGLFVGEQLTSIISLFVNPTNQVARFRKFATLETEQGKGYGTKLLNHVLSEAQHLKVSRIWCNARVEKTSFYEKFGMTTAGEETLKEGTPYINMEKCYS